MFREDNGENSFFHTKNSIFITNEPFEKKYPDLLLKFQR